ncbi:protein Loquacious [Halictus rubicundus]|uniref:protein Loquacious n=1 Tax=Halictus rubicundus TaxID=77578 RepID=UPI0040354841
MMKTPVSILQEMMVKEQTVPNYELIHDGGGTHMNTFTYQVTCDGLRAIGTGRSKKDAKHEAAKAMLEVIATHRGHLQLPAPPSQSPLRTPLPPVIPETERLPPNVPFVNAVGALKELCVENSLQEPDYVQISDVGPPHIRVFTFQCKVANFREVGVARTKKQAKQEAAKKMLHKLIDLVADLNVTELSNEESKGSGEENEANEIAKSRYPTLSRLPTTKKINLGFKIAEYHIKVKESLSTELCNDLGQKLELLVSQDHSNITKEYVQEFQLSLKDLLLSVNLELWCAVLEPIKENTYVIAAKVNTSPEIVEIAIADTEENAMFNALLKLINILIHFSN